MFGFKNYWKNNEKFIVLLSLFSLFRLYLGMNLPIWLFPPAIYDDILMFDYSHLAEHFLNWNIQSLSKDIAYPIFLFFVRVSQISYKFWMTLLWIIAAILVTYGVYKFLSKNKRILIFSYLFVLFLPVAFDVLCGQRVYRNALITPLTIIFLAMLYIFISNILNYSSSDHSINIKDILIWGILLGLTFTFNYYIKEDGILTLPILVVCIFSVLLFKLFELFKRNKFSFSKQNFYKIIRITLICIVPLIIFAAGTFAYQEVNNTYFGVAEINTRTSGQLGEFYSNLLKIDDSNKNTQIWIPATTVQKAVDASPTLKSHPEFLDAWLDTPWDKNTVRNSTIPGDISAWSLRTALKNINMYNDEKSTNDFFFKVNKELDSAFDNGTLKKSDKIFITSSANGKDVDEIFELTPYVASGLEMTFFYDGFEVNNANNKITSFYMSNDMSKNASRDIHDSFIKESELKELSAFEVLPIILIGFDISVYHIISYFVVAISFACFLGTCIYQIRNRFEKRNLNMLIIFNIMLIGTVLVQIFAIAWFCSYLGTHPWVGSLNNLLGHIKFHLVSAYGFFALFVVFSFAGVFSIIDKIELED